MVRVDGRSFFFINGKSERSHFLKRNPRNVSWTILYRRKNKKGITEEIAKKRSKRTTKTARAIAGASLAEIIAKRNQRPEVREALRDQAIRYA